MAVRYDRSGSLAGTTFHGSVDAALASALAEGCRYLSVGEHPKAKTTRHFAHREGRWLELGDGDELDRLMSTEEPRMFWRAA
jgi:hypothetical protein